jgi:hypothetical protein
MTPERDEKGIIMLQTEETTWARAISFNSAEGGVVR